MTTTHELGWGILNWMKDERICDRYGLIHLDYEIPRSLLGSISREIPLALEGLVGKEGKLRAHILEARKSTHIGDLHHKIFPVTPQVGDVIDLGVGTLFCEHYLHVGTRPKVPRNRFWMNPWNLYRCHEQTVLLEFVEGDLNMESWKIPAGEVEFSIIAVELPDPNQSN